MDFPLSRRPVEDWTVVLPEEGYGKIQVNRLLRQKDSEHKEQQKVEKHRRKMEEEPVVTRI